MKSRKSHFCANCSINYFAKYFESLCVSVSSGVLFPQDFWICRCDSNCSLPAVLVRHSYCRTKSNPGRNKLECCRISRKQKMDVCTVKNVLLSHAGPAESSLMRRCLNLLVQYSVFFSVAFSPNNYRG